VTKLFRQTPELLLGFDTETTGLDVNTDRAISYGFCAYRFGELIWSEHVFVLPDRPIAPAAAKVHGLDMDSIAAKAPAHQVLSVEAGVLYATRVLQDYHERGAYIVGSNVVRFDLEMLRRTAMSTLETPLQDDSFDISLLRVIDVREHDLAMEPSRVERPRRGLEHLCRHYGVTPGGHDALADAVASVEVLQAQVLTNNRGQAALALATEPSSFFASWGETLTRVAKRTSPQ